MSILKHIHHDQMSCSVCGAPVSMEAVQTHDGKISVHCNGDRWETRRFACGASIHYSANFRRVDVEDKCPKTPEIVERDRRRKEALKKMNGILNELLPDEDDRRYVQNRIGLDY